MSFDYFSKRRMQYILEKLKTIFDTKTETWTGTQAELAQQLSSIKNGTVINITDDDESLTTNLSALTDTDISSPDDGQVLIYDDANDKWVNQYLNLSDLSDIDINSLTLSNGQILKYDLVNDVWENADDTPIWVGTQAELAQQLSSLTEGTIINITDDQEVLGGSLSTLSDTNISTPTNGQALVYDSTSAKWKNQSLSIPQNISQMSDVDIDSSTLENGQILKYNSDNNVWENVDDTGGASAFEDLTDVSLNNLQNGQVPKWNSSTEQWENSDEAGGTPTWTGTMAEYIAQASQIAPGTIVNITDDIDNIPQFKVTNFVVGTTGWTTDTTSQSGTMLYKKQISVNNIYSSPSVDIGASTGHVLPTTDEQTAYDLLQYVTFDSSVPCLYLYAKLEPANAFNINVGGVD